MKILEKWWFKLIINLVISVVLFFGLVIGLADNSQGGSLFIGAFTLAGQLFFLLAFDTIGRFKNKVTGAIRYVFVIIGAVIIIAAGVLSTVLLASGNMTGNPWFDSFFSLWFLNGAISFIFYYIINEEVLPEILYGLLPIGSLVASYLLNVVFLYLGLYVHPFFNDYFALVLCFVLAVIMFIIIKKNGGIEFDGTFFRKLDEEAQRQNAPAKPKTTTKAHYDDDDGEYVDNRKSGSGLWNNALEKAVNRAIGRVQAGYYSPRYGKIESVRLNSTVYFNTVSVSGTVNYRITYPHELQEHELKDDVQSVLQEISDKLSSEIEDAVDNVRREYKGFDGDINLKTNITPKISG